MVLHVEIEIKLRIWRERDSDSSDWWFDLRNLFLASYYRFPGPFWIFLSIISYCASFSLLLYPCPFVFFRISWINRVFLASVIRKFLINNENNVDRLSLRIFYIINRYIIYIVYNIYYIYMHIIYIHVAGCVYILYTYGRQLF